MTEIEQRTAAQIYSVLQGLGKARNPIFYKMAFRTKVDGKPMPANLRVILMDAAWEVRHRLPPDLQVFVALKGGMGAEK